MSKALLLSSFFISVFLVSGTKGHAQTDDIYNCKGITNAAERLSCYDRVMNTPDVTPKPEPTPQSDDIIMIRRSDIEKAKKESFGLSSTTTSTLDDLVRAAEANEASVASVGKIEAIEESPKSFTTSLEQDEVNLTIRETRVFGREKTRFFFTNGQVWDQTDSLNFRVPKPKDGNTLTADISTAAFGSFLLRVNGKGRAIRVKRVR